MAGGVDQDGCWPNFGAPHPRSHPFDDDEEPNSDGELTVEVAIRTSEHKLKRPASKLEEEEIVEVAKRPAMKKGPKPEKTKTEKEPKVKAKAKSKTSSPSKMKTTKTSSPSKMKTSSPSKMKTMKKGKHGKGGTASGSKDGGDDAGGLPTSSPSKPKAGCSKCRWRGCSQCRAKLGLL